MKVSKKYIISIWEFIENYYGIIYDGNYKLTHDELSFYFNEKELMPLKRSNFKEAKDDKILSGEILLVKDEVGKIIPYVNPHRFEDFDIRSFSNNNYSVFDYVDNDNSLKNIGKYDYYSYKKEKDKVLSRKKRVLRRKYN